MTTIIISASGWVEAVTSPVMVSSDISENA